MMSSNAAEAEAFPVASQTLEKRPGQGWWTVLPLVALLTCVGLFLYTQRHSGVQITIEFRDGHGLKPQDVLKHKGIVVGEVERIELNSELDSVVATVRLAGTAKRLAKEGSRFWIVRPNISIDSIGGLDTILGAKYLAVSPGPANAPDSNSFIGLDSAPIIAPKSGSLEIVLDSPHRSGLMPNAPILYRGYTIGRIIDIGLASDARSVRARCAIDPEFKNLVRADTKFWKQTGWKLNIGLTGVKVDAETLPQLLTGSIEMATPPTQGVPAASGASYELYPEADQDWLKWAPGISGAESGFNTALPVPIRITHSWSQNWFGLTSKKQSSGWMLPMEDGSLLSSASQFTVPPKATSGTTTLQIAEQIFDPTSIAVKPLGGTHANDSPIIASIPDLNLSAYQRWPVAKLTLATSRTTLRNVILVQYPAQSSIWVDSARLTIGDHAWLIDPTVMITPDMAGLPVVDAETKNVLGTLAYDPVSESGVILLIDTSQVGN